MAVLEDYYEQMMMYNDTNSTFLGKRFTTNINGAGMVVLSRHNSGMGRSFVAGADYQKYDNSFKRLKSEDNREFEVKKRSRVSRDIKPRAVQGPKFDSDLQLFKKLEDFFSMLNMKKDKKASSISKIFQSNQQQETDGRQYKAVNYI